MLTGIVKGRQGMPKMYIAVREEVPAHMVPVLVAHAAINAHMQFRGSQEYEDWLVESFKKVVVKVSEKEFNRICKDYECQGVFVGFEATVMEGLPSVAVTMPTTLPRNCVKFAKLWRP